MSNQTRIIIASIVSSVGVFFVTAYVGLGLFLFNFALNPTENWFPKNIYSEQKHIINEEFMQTGTDVYMTNRSGLKLHGYTFEQAETSNKWLIAMHGYRGSALSMSDYGYNFYNQGYNVLIPEQRGMGDSEGDYIGMGWLERLDLCDWINYIVDKNANSEIVLLGVSMGASTVMLAVGEDLPSNVKVAIEDCGYTSIYEQMKYCLKYFGKIGTFPAINSAEPFCKLFAKYSLYDGDCVQSLKKSNIPMLFAHGSADIFVPFYMQDILFDAFEGEKAKIVIEGAEHTMSSSVKPTEYWQGVWDFVQNYI